MKLPKTSLKEFYLIMHGRNAHRAILAQGRNDQENARFWAKQARFWYSYYCQMP